MKKPIYKKWWFWLLVIIVIGGIGNMGDSEETKPAVAEAQASAAPKQAVTTQATATTKPAASAKPEKTQAQKAAEEAAAKKKVQQAVLQFEKDLYAAEKGGTPIFKQYSQIMTALSEGKTDLLTAYNAAKQAKQAADVIQTNYYSLAVPKGLPKEVSKLLRESKDNMATAYYVKGEAMDNVLEYFDSQKLSDLSDFQDKIKEADQLTILGVSNLFQAKEKAGIDITK